VVDDLAQASHAGEINVPIRDKAYSPERVHAELGEVLAGKKPGRIGQDEITIFDSTGLAIQDVATGAWVLERAREKGMGKTL